MLYTASSEECTASSAGVCTDSSGVFTVSSGVCTASMGVCTAILVVYITHFLLYGVHVPMSQLYCMIPLMLIFGCLRASSVVSDVRAEHICNVILLA